MKSGLLVMTLALGISSLAYAQSAQKIAYVDLQRVIRDSQAGKSAKTAFEGEFQQKRNILEQKKQQLDATRQDFIKKAAVMEEKARSQKAEEIDRLDKDLTRKRDDFREELQKRDLELTQRILTELQDVIKQVGASGGYTLIVERTEGGVVFAADSADLTNEVIKAYDGKKAGAKK
ncbi:MAG: OmpH family outer membrane protein [Deltaproteobacteria bacterium]